MDRVIPMPKLLILTLSIFLFIFSSYNVFAADYTFNFNDLNTNFTIQSNQIQDFNCNNHPIAENNLSSYTTYSNNIITKISAYAWGCNGYNIQTISPTERKTGFLKYNDSYFYPYTPMLFIRDYAIASGSFYNVSNVLFLNDTYYSRTENISVFVRNTGGAHNLYVSFINGNAETRVFKLTSENNQNYTLYPNAVIYNNGGDFIFNRIDFIYEVDGAYTAMFRQFTVYNISSYSGNHLPIVNFTVDNIVCKNDSELTYTANLSIDAIDLEGDNIYYATKLNTVSEKLSYLFFGTIKCWLGDCEIKYNLDSLNKFVLPYPNTCKISYPLNSSTFGLANFQGEDEEYTYLMLNKNCPESDKSIYYKLDREVNYLNHDFILSGLNINESFNITYYDNIFNPVLTVINEINSSGLFIYNYNGTKNLIGSYKIGYDALYQIRALKDYYNLRVYNWSNGATAEIGIYTNYTGKISDNNIRYFSISIDDKSSIFYRSGSSFLYGESTPIFSTIKPNNLTLTAKSNTITLYVTDLIHLNTDYELYEQTVNILDSNLCIDNIYNIADTDTDLIEYHNKNGYTGVMLILDQFLWFIQFPYRFSLYFGFSDILILGVSCAFIVSLFMIYFNFKMQNLASLIFIGFGMSLFLTYMKIIYPVIVWVFAFLLAIIIYNNVIKSNSTGV